MAEPHLKLTYFDAPVSRGEECRLALHVAGVAFEDNRLKNTDWADLKPTTPFGALPTLETPGKPTLAQSNAILAYVGREHGLLPNDAWEAARHLAVLSAVEELRGRVDPSMRTKDPAEKQRMREELAAGYMQQWGASVERQIEGPFFGGERISVADVKLFVILTWIEKGVLDHMPRDVFAKYPKLCALGEAVRNHPRVAEWRARFA